MSKVILNIKNDKLFFHLSGDRLAEIIFLFVLVLSAVTILIFDAGSQEEIVKFLAGLTAAILITLALFEIHFYFDNSLRVHREMIIFRHGISTKEFNKNNSKLYAQFIAENLYALYLSDNKDSFALLNPRPMLDAEYTGGLMNSSEYFKTHKNFFSFSKSQIQEIASFLKVPLSKTPVKI